MVGDNATSLTARDYARLRPISNQLLQMNQITLNGVISNPTPKS